MSPSTRSSVMSRIRGANTGPEVTIAAELKGRDLRFEQHAKDLPGRPDIIFREARVAVFIDGDFWHGWRFPLWKDKLSPAWRTKIAQTRARDRRNFKRLRRAGWIVIRIWEHQIEQNTLKCVDRIVESLKARTQAFNNEGDFLG